MTAPPSDPTDPTQLTAIAAVRRHMDRAGRDWLNDDDIATIAHEAGVPQQAVEEVASFYSHFRRGRRPRLVEVGVCRDLTCHLRGAGELIDRLAIRFASDPRIEVRSVSCLGRCDRAVAACVTRFPRSGGGSEPPTERYHTGQTALGLSEVVEEVARGAWPTDGHEPVARPGPTGWTIDPYRGDPTYAAADAFLADVRAAKDRAAARARRAEELIGELESANLCGMGGAGVPAHRKWKDVARAATGGGPKYVVGNADESEPGTFKDRELMLRTPHLVVEGVILAGLAVGASRGYVFIRHEYPAAADRVREAIAAAERAGVCGPDAGGTGIDFWVRVHVSPGGYICGEQHALIEAMEGKRAQPRNRPPELAANGLFDAPTLVNNVETLAWVPFIATHGGAQFAALGHVAPDKRYAGKRFFSVSGDVAAPGVYETPIGAPVRDLLAAAGGIIGGEDALEAIATSGPSGGFLPRHPRDRQGNRPDLLDLPLDLVYFRDQQWMLGAGLVVYTKLGLGTRTVLDLAVNATEFFARESCGKCVPCRVGSQKLVQIGREVHSRARDPGDAAALVEDLGTVLDDTSICGLGQVAAVPLRTALTQFDPPT
jgi:NADH:ubiquinone oxidoreductase subunit F (NADH-binding)